MFMPIVFWLKLGPKGPDNSCKLIPHKWRVCQNTPLEAVFRDCFGPFGIPGARRYYYSVSGLFPGITVVFLGLLGLISVISLGLAY